MRSDDPDIVDDLNHEMIHGLARIEAARHIFLSLVRRCPYAGCDGSPCEEVREVLGDTERKTMAPHPDGSASDPVR